MCQVNDKIGWGPPSYLKRVDKGESTEGESDSDDEYLGLPGCKCMHRYSVVRAPMYVCMYVWRHSTLALNSSEL